MIVRMINATEFETSPYKRSKQRSLILLAATVFTVALLIRLACFTGLIASDDLGYVNYARQISDGTYELASHHYAIRYGVIVPVGNFVSNIEEI